MPVLEAEYPVTVNRLEKVIYPEAGVCKKDILEYVIHMQAFLLPYLQNRALTTIRYPNGIHDKSFYQKNIPDSAPEWVTRYRERSSKSTHNIDYILADSVSTLMWLANQVCLEWHVGFNTIMELNQPTYLAIDLDPTVKGFEKVVEVALYVRDILESLLLPSYPKTSGATGLQIFIPITKGVTYQQTRIVLEFVARYVVEKHPRVATIERMVKDRGDKIYIDYLQHAPHKTLISPYSLRAVPEACVSTPVTWRELEQGARPQDFTIHTIRERVAMLGDLFQPVMGPGVDLSYILKQLS